MEVILGCLGFACVCGAGAAYQIISKKRRIAKMSDEELIKEYDSLVHKIELTTSTCNGLKGLGSNMATNTANNDIIEYRNQGKKIGAELESRGYSVNYTLLNGSVAKSSSNTKSVTKSAIVGGIIAGETGAIIGAMDAINKNNQNQK